MGINATCCVTPRIIWKRLADQPASSRRARVGPKAPAKASSLPSASCSIKAETSLATSAGYQPDGTMSIVQRGMEFTSWRAFLPKTDDLRRLDGFWRNRPATVAEGLIAGRKAANVLYLLPFSAAWRTWLDLPLGLSSSEWPLSEVDQLAIA